MSTVIKEQVKLKKIVNSTKSRRKKSITLRKKVTKPKKTELIKIVKKIKIAE